jgi:flagellar biosynthetic protein FlhB
MVCITTFTASCPISAKLGQPVSDKLKSIDLQLFAGEKTEEATSKRKGEARSKGQVAKSMEINSVFGLIAAFFALKMFGTYMYTELTNFMIFLFSHFSTDDFTINTMQELLLNFSLVFFKTVLPVMVIILITAVLVNILQVGIVFSTESLMPDLSKLNPLTGLTRLVSKRSLVEIVKSFGKIAIISYFIYRFILQEATQLPTLINAELIDSLKLVGALVLKLAFQISAVMFVLAVADFFYQRWEHSESLKMSKQEVKEEYKQTEGNPEIKSKIKERQRAMSMQRMMQEVPHATVIVTNPTHFAVALKYEKQMIAPVVVAKGQDFMAQRIKEVAKENRVVIVENKPLARALYSSAEVGAVVPTELYQAVAEVLAYVYRLKKRLT